MGSGFSKLKKQAKQFESQYAKIQEEMRALEITGTAGNGLVTLVLNGEHELKDLKIKPAVLIPMTSKDSKTSYELPMQTLMPKSKPKANKACPADFHSRTVN